MKNAHPYEVAQEHSARPFLALETPTGLLALPWHGLKQIRLNAAGDQLSLDYQAQSVKITGTGLAVIAELACAFRLKTLRTGDASDVRIDTLRIIGMESE